MRQWLRELQAAAVQFERPVILTTRERTFPNAPYPVRGIHGRIDCVVQHRDADRPPEVSEDKFTTELTDEYRLQVFLYALMLRVQQEASSDPLTTSCHLHNWRTGESLHGEIAADAPSRELLEAVIELHYDHGRTVEDVMDRLQSCASRKRCLPTEDPP